MEVHTREGHPFQWLHGPHKDPYKVTEYGEKLGLGSREYELVDVLPLEYPGTCFDAVYCGTLIIHIKYRS